MENAGTQSQQPPSTPAPAATPTPHQGPVQEKKRSSTLPWVFSGILLVLLIIVSIVAILMFSTGETSLKKALRSWLYDEEASEESDSDDSDTEDDEDLVDDVEDDTDEDDQDDTDDTDADDADSEDADDDLSDMADGWAEYHNDAWYIGFKHPLDLTVSETNPSPGHTVLAVKGGGNISVITIWLQSDGVMDDILSNMLANQCTDEITFSDVTFGSHTFRKALDVPMENCLANPRDQELAAYGVLLPGEVIMTIRNDGLNQEQLEAFLATVYGD